MVDQRDLVGGCFSSVGLRARCPRQQAAVHPRLGRSLGLDLDLSEQLVDVASRDLVSTTRLDLPDPSLATTHRRPRPPAIRGTLLALGWPLTACAAEPRMDFEAFTLLIVASHELRTAFRR